MPLKEFERGQLFLGNEGMGFYILGEVTEIELDERGKISEDISVLNIGGSYEFAVEIQPSERMTVGDAILVLCGFDGEKLKQNNWRKMHGMAMHRRNRRI